MNAPSLANTRFIEWSYRFSQAKKVLWTRQGSGPLEAVEFTPPPNALDSTMKSSSVDVLVTLISETEGVRDTMLTALKVPLAASINDQKIKRLALATFDIRSSTLSARDEQLLNVFMSRLDDGDQVFITGYSDDLGERESNLRLSQRRADVVAEAAQLLRPDVKILSTRGVGSREYPSGITSYASPEERFLSRVVQLSIVE
jgi:outer membrane protein OmpA-like peptidoglycan-associated protein